MFDVLDNLSAAATSRLDQPAASTAFARFQGGPVGSLIADEAELRSLFAAEAAFAAVARIALEERHGGPLGDSERLFPHLFGSTLFSWFSPDRDARLAVLDALQSVDDEPLAVLGWLYQFTVPEKLRKTFGQFYTNAEIVGSMLDGVGFAGQAALNGRLIDPACGAGAYLIEATRRVIAAGEDAQLTSAEICAAVQQTIHGLDINPLGLLLTEAAVAFLLVPHLGDHPGLDPMHLHVTDSLRADLDLISEEHPDAMEIKSRVGMFSGGFDWVVANPPYAKWPSRLLSEQQAARFAKTTYGHPNLYGLFLQVGVELLAEHGRIAFINPRSFSSGLYFQHLRRFLCDTLDFESFHTFHKRTGLFAGVLQDVVVLTATRGAGQRPIVHLREYNGAPCGKPLRHVAAPADSVILGDRLGGVFFLTPDETVHRVLTRMLDSAVPLVDAGFSVATGTLVWNRVKPLIRDADESGAVPLVWANAIRPFRFGVLGNRKGLATHCAMAPETESIITRGPGLFIKRLTAKEETRRIVACSVPDELASSPRGYFAENHVNVVRPRDDAVLSVDGISGLLNSQLYDYVFRALNGNTQVSATELRMLPVPEDISRLNDIVTVARSLSLNPDEDRGALDAAVFNVFEIAQEDRDVISGFYATDR